MSRCRRSSAALSLAAIFSFRMLGLFMILPVFALYAPETFGTVPPVLIGLAIGAYGLSQAALQIPFGMLSDRLGCKPLIAFGLVVFALGSAMAATADSIGGIGAVFGFCALAAALWWVRARTMVPPRYLSSYMISMGESRAADDSAEAARRECVLLALPGVAETVVVMEEGVAYL